jgi:hypothetical protein
MPSYHHKCCYVGCINISSKNCGTSFFKFPIRDDKIVLEWVKNCGNIKLTDKDISELKFRKVCEKHFHEHDIVVSTRNKHLRKNAVPKKSNRTGNSYLRTKFGKTIVPHERICLY